jgi:hypothetical protein
MSDSGLWDGEYDDLREQVAGIIGDHYRGQGNGLIFTAADDILKLVAGDVKRLLEENAKLRHLEDTARAWVAANHAWANTSPAKRPGGVIKAFEALREAADRHAAAVEALPARKDPPEDEVSGA